METDRQQVLICVDPMTVIVEPKLLKPSDWDKKAVAEDLREYVSLSRLNKGTPVVRLVGGVLKLVSGEPFLRAAREADPRIDEIVCLAEADEQTVQSFGFKTINASQLLDKYSENEPYDALEILTFTRALTSVERENLEERIIAFFSQVSAQPLQYGGNYSSISPMKWDKLNKRVSWTWKRNDRFGPHVMLFLEILRDVDKSVVQLRSWNGLTL